MSKLKTNKKKLIIIIILIISASSIYVISQKQSNQIQTNILQNELIPYDKEKNETETTNKTEENEIIIHITGAINKEGVYTLKENSRVSDAINLAEGLREDADTSQINLAYPLEDGMKINIPSVNDKNEENTYITNEIGIEIKNEQKEENNSSKININTATKEELDTLPGIGESTAQKIINYRKEKGKFSNIEEIKEVSGIGESKFENIKELICI